MWVTDVHSCNAAKKTGEGNLWCESWSEEHHTGLDSLEAYWGGGSKGLLSNLVGADLPQK